MSYKVNKDSFEKAEKDVEQSVNKLVGFNFKKFATILSIIGLIMVFLSLLF